MVLGGQSAAYAYKYDHRLTSVTSSFFDEGTVNYEYTGSGTRFSRESGAEFTRYRWGGGLKALSEEDDGGTLTRTYIGGAARLGHVDGANPASGAYHYYAKDIILSTRSVFDGSKALAGAFEFAPFGAALSANGAVAAALSSPSPLRGGDRGGGIFEHRS